MSAKTHKCPVCGMTVVLRATSDGCHVLPTHGHRIHGRRARCPVSSYSVEGLAIVQTICNAFGQLAGG